MSQFQGFRSSMLSALDKAGKEFFLLNETFPPDIVGALGGPIWSDACVAHSQLFYGHYLNNVDWQVDNRTAAMALSNWTSGGPKKSIDEKPWPGNAGCAYLS